MCMPTFVIESTRVENIGAKEDTRGHICSLLWLEAWCRGNLQGSRLILVQQFKTIGQPKAKLILAFRISSGAFFDEVKDAG